MRIDGFKPEKRLGSSRTSLQTAIRHMPTSYNNLWETLGGISVARKLYIKHEFKNRAFPTGTGMNRIPFNNNGISFSVSYSRGDEPG